LSICIVVPVRNPAKHWQQWLAGINRQVPVNPVVLIDSSSDDGTSFTGLPVGSKVVRIQATDFNHGATRNLALEHLPVGTDVVVLMTQDAVLLNSDSVLQLTNALSQADAACAYGRQLPHLDATPLAAHTRHFNYPENDQLNSLSDRVRLGLKACFLSNSFAAYRLNDLQAAGGFPNDVILGEDMYVAAKFLLSGKRTAYVSGAIVRHSHNYTLLEEFRRYFDTGVFHARNVWLMHAFGTVQGEGLKYLRSEVRHLWHHSPRWIGAAVSHTVAKWCGYQVGRLERYLPITLKQYLSMHKAFWLQEAKKREKK
jgi:rhamnosyltransferase